MQCNKQGQGTIQYTGKGAGIDHILDYETPITMQ
jgi:hypothetical protein